MSRIAKDIEPFVGSNAGQSSQEIFLLQKLKTHDEYTYLHSLNVARLSVGLGKRLGFNDEELQSLGWAALLHDIGKVSIPTHLLNKPSSFSPDELKTVRSHPWASLIELANETPISLKDIKHFTAAFEHHQRYDLLGYPEVVAKIRLHPFSRIIAIADTFDAMTSDRIYHRRVLPDVALKIMAQGFGSIFDPIVLHAFIAAMGAYPVSSVVRLSDETIAIVSGFSEHSDMDRPIVMRARDTNRIQIDLMRSEHRHLRILKSEFPEDHGLRVADFLGESE